MSDYESNTENNDLNGMNSADHKEIIDATRAFEGDKAADEITHEVRGELKDVFENLAHAYALQDVPENDPEFESIKSTHFEAIIDSGTTEEEARTMLVEVRNETLEALDGLQLFDDDYEFGDEGDDDEIFEDDDDEHFLGDPDAWKKAA